MLPSNRIPKCRAQTTSLCMYLGVQMESNCKHLHHVCVCKKNQGKTSNITHLQSITTDTQLLITPSLKQPPGPGSLSDCHGEKTCWTESVSKHTTAQHYLTSDTSHRSDQLDSRCNTRDCRAVHVLQFTAICKPTVHPCSSTHTQAFLRTTAQLIWPKKPARIQLNLIKQHSQQCHIPT